LRRSATFVRLVTRSCLSKGRTIMVISGICTCRNSAKSVGRCRSRSLSRARISHWVGLMEWPSRASLIHFRKPARSMNCRFYAIQHWLARADRGWCRLGRDRSRCGHHRRRVHAVCCAGRSDLVAVLIRVRIPPGVHSSTCDAAERPCPPSTPARARKWVALRVEADSRSSRRRFGGGDGRREGTASSWLETCRIFWDRGAVQGPRGATTASRGYRRRR
jgi:hypothetical protein